MKQLVHSEWIKFRSVRSTVVTLVLAAALVTLVAVLAARDANKNQITLVHLSGLTGGVSFAVLLFGVLGVQIIGQEYRFNTIRPTFTAAPNRLKVLLAKLIVVTGACATAAVIMVAFCWLVGSAMIDNFSVDGTDRRIAWGIVLFSALWAGAGMAIGSIVRQPIAAILILLGESLILENLIGGLLEGTFRWMPFSNGFQMTFRLDDTPDQLRPLLQGGLYFTAVVVAMWVVGAILVNKRDA